MAAQKNPTDIARETLKLLALRKVAPTPENYQRIFHEIAGTVPEDDVTNGVLAALRDLPKKMPPLEKTVRQLEKALVEKKWPEFMSGLTTLAQHRPSAVGEGNAWPDLIRELIKQWEAKQVGLSSTRKRESLERMLITFGNDPALPTKLQGLLKSWSENAAQAAGGIEPLSSGGTQPAAEASVVRPAAVEESVGLRLARDMMVQTLEIGVVPRLQKHPALAAEGRQFVQTARALQSLESWQKFTADIKKFWFKLEIEGANDEKLFESLLHLMRLMVENIGELVEDDQWLKGQVAIVQEIVTSPLSPKMLEDAERSFKEVIFKQGTLKHSLGEAKATLKSMISTFVERLGELSVATGEYHDKIGGYMEQIIQADDITALNRLLDGLMNDTRGIQLDVLRSRDEIANARRLAEEAEQKVRRLEMELVEVSGKVREDQLTGLLNRRGLEDAMERELARSERQKKPLCVAVIDLDNFKRLNDTYGHQAGDEALMHLSQVIKSTMRPTDVVARYGGEEFVILLPETPLDEASKVTIRLQRELTKRFFLHDNERLLITFSAGIALHAPGESQESVIERADKAMYQAKQQGKNRVVLAS